MPGSDSYCTLADVEQRPGEWITVRHLDDYDLVGGEEDMLKIMMEPNTKASLRSWAHGCLKALRAELDARGLDTRTVAKRRAICEASPSDRTPAEPETTALPPPPRTECGPATVQLTMFDAPPEPSRKKPRRTPPGPRIRSSTVPQSTEGEQ
jgi:hypothetical protein